MCVHLILVFVFLSTINKMLDRLFDILSGILLQGRGQLGRERSASVSSSKGGSCTGSDLAG